MTPANIIDIILIAILALGLIVGLVRGLIHTLLGVVIFVVALLGSGFIADAAAQPVADWVQPHVESFVMESLMNAGAAAEEEVSVTTAALDASLLEGFGDVASKVVDNAIGAAMEALGNSLGGILYSVSYLIIFLLSMLVLTWLLRFITSPLRLVDRVPVLGLANRLGGAVLGLILGVLVCFLIAAVVKVTGMIDPSDTYLYSFFAANTPKGLLALLR